MVIRSEVYAFLDELRESGITNMFGAAPYIADEFGINEREARAWLKSWMSDFGKE